MFGDSGDPSSEAPNRLGPLEDCRRALDSGVEGGLDESGTRYMVKSSVSHILIEIPVCFASFRGEQKGR